MGLFDAFVKSATARENPGEVQGEPDREENTPPFGVATIEVTPYCNRLRGAKCVPRNRGSVASGSDGLVASSSRKTSLRKQQTAERAQVVQNAPARGDMEVELSEIKGNQQQCFFSAVSAFPFGRNDLGFYIPTRFVQGFRQQGHVFVRTLDTVKRRFGLVAHRHAFPTTPASAVGPC